MRSGLGIRTVYQGVSHHHGARGSPSPLVPSPSYTAKGWPLVLQAMSAVDDYVRRGLPLGSACTCNTAAVSRMPAETSKEPTNSDMRPAHGEDPNIKKGPPGIDANVADADKQVRTGQKREPVRNTPPAGTWNDTSAD